MSKSKQKLTEQDVKHVAQLARIKLTPSEVKKFQKMLVTVLDYVDVLNKLDTEKTEPTAQVTGLVNKLRKDRTEQSLEREEVLLNAPQKKNGCFKVRAVLGGK